MRKQKFSGSGFSSKLEKNQEKLQLPQFLYESMHDFELLSYLQLSSPFAAPSLLHTKPELDFKKENRQFALNGLKIRLIEWRSAVLSFTNFLSTKENSEHNLAKYAKLSKVELS